MGSQNPPHSHAFGSLVLILPTMLVIHALPPLGGHLDFVSPDQLLQHEDLGANGGALPLAGNIWDRERRPRAKPRKKDLFEPRLMMLLGRDYDARWMKKSRDKQEIMTGYDEFIDRKTIRTLRALVNISAETGISPEDDLRLPESLPHEYREVVKNWLIHRATCPVKFTWHNLGDLWYPRWVSRGECVGASSGRGRSCSWPPGMVCAPSGTKVLYLLRWHCRKRKPKKRKKVNEYNLSPEDALTTNTYIGQNYLCPENQSSSENRSSVENQIGLENRSGLESTSFSVENLSNAEKVIGPENHPSPENLLSRPNRLRRENDSSLQNGFSPVSSEDKTKAKRFRQRHKCSWLKVPFPVPSDCSCSCKP